jgi:hypothetical protein
MVDTGRYTNDILPTHPSGHTRRRLLVAGTVGTAVLAVAAALVLPFHSPASATAGRGSTAPHGVLVAVHHQTTHRPTASVTVTPAATPAVGAVVTPTTTTPVPVAVPPVAAGPTLAALVAQVEAAGIEPGSGWSWSVGDTTECGVIAGSGPATGCTSWSAGVIRTVFSGQPALPLVAHELANAETEADAVPALLSQVATSAAGSSWSPTDAVASCLVVHFLHIQDDAAGSWQCPDALADAVAAHIHDTVTTTQTTAVCGAASNMASTLTFVAGSGTLTVTSPAGGAPVQTAPAGTPVTVSGIGTFTAVDQGGTVTESGTCTA